MSGLIDALTGMSNSISEIVGAPIYIGIFLLILFLGWIAVSGMKGDGKALILILAATLSIVFFPAWFVQEIALLGAFILVAAIMKLVGKW